MVIKKADKGSVVVIMDTQNYITEGYRQLNNDNHYEKINEPIYPRTAIQIIGIFNKLKSTGAISEKQFQFLSSTQEPRPRYFYMLHTIHRGQLLVNTKRNAPRKANSV